MLRAVKRLSNVDRVDITVAILVKLGKGLVDPLLAGCAGLATDLEEELVEVNGAVLFGVEGIKQHLGFSLGDVHTVVFQTEVELLLVQLARPVVLGDDMEGASEAAQLSGSLGEDHLLDLGEDYKR